MRGEVVKDDSSLTPKVMAYCRPVMRLESWGQEPRFQHKTNEQKFPNDLPVI
jgi:hypothetical protein